jgi:hypothetical protein
MHVWYGNVFASWKPLLTFQRFIFQDFLFIEITSFRLILLLR